MKVVLDAALVTVLSALLLLGCSSGDDAGRIGASADRRPAPPGWLPAGSRVEDYELDLDPAGGRNGGPALRIAAAVPAAQGFGGVSRQVDPAPYRGRRLALSAFVRAAGVEGWAGLWMRIDTAGQRSWALDNMRRRPIRGSRDWRRYRVVLDVPGDAVEIHYGAVLNGPGTVWIEGFELAEAEPEEPSTEPGSRLRGRGLDFEPRPPGEGG